MQMVVGARTFGMGKNMARTADDGEYFMGYIENCAQLACTCKWTKITGAIIASSPYFFDPGPWLLKVDS
jgi:hypothetical protein